ncbi:MAG: hypothetical protein OXC60_02360 [Litoreibacter sp.]|nr:hypothetical protein [Litoreibacter sp.]
MTFLLIFLGVVGGLAVLLRVKRVGVFVAFACLLGLAFEVSLGGSAPAFRALSPTWFVAISALTLVSYACIFYLPLRLLLGPLPINLNRR